MFNPANNNIYVPNRGSNIISVIDISNKVIDNITIPEPVFLEFNPANNNTYVSSIKSNVISVINSANKLIQNVTLFGVDPFSNFGLFTTPQLEFNPANTNMYIENPLASCNTVVHSSDSSFGSSTECESTVAVVDSNNNTVIGNVFTGPVTNFKFNPANKNVYAVGGIMNEGRDILVIAES
jgi:YVTN family beta-propeller protein